LIYTLTLKLINVEQQLNKEASKLKDSNRNISGDNTKTIQDLGINNGDTLLEVIGF